MPESNLMLPLLFLGKSLNVVLVFLGIGVLIFVHELGHFLVAKWNKVRVEAFSLGFGPVLFGFHYKGTHYRISAVPLGGYVRMAGGDAPTAEYKSNDPGEFPNKPLLSRMSVLLAGVVMNAIVGIFLFVLAFNVGVPLMAPIAGDVVTASPAWKAGIRSGDVIASINGAKILDFDDIYSEIALSDGPLDIVIRRGEQEISCPGIVPAKDPDIGVRTIGIYPTTERVMRVEDGSAAAEAGLRSGDEVLTVGGYKSTTEFGRAMGRSDGPVTFVVRRDGGVRTFDLTPRLAPAEHGRALIGISPLVKTIEAVRPGSDAEAAGFKAGDEIVKVGDRPVASHLDAIRILTEAPPAETTFTVLRGGARVPVGPVALEATAGAWRLFFDGLFAPGSLKIAAVSLLQDRDFDGQNPSRAAGLVEGAVVRSVNGKETKTFLDVQKAIGATGKGEPVTVTFSLPGREEVKGPVTIVRKVPRSPTYGISFRRASVTVKVPGIIAATKEGLKRSYLMSRRVLQMIGGIFSGRVSAKTIGGPIAIFQLSYDAAERNFIHLLYFLGLLSINLAVLNILPIPVLDGGHIMFLLIEAVRRKPLSDRSMALAQWAGLLFLLLVMVFVVTQDVSRLLQ